MKKKLVWIGVGVLVIAGFAFLTLPLVQPRCQRWYHSVDWRSDRKAFARYDTDWGGIEKRLGRERTLEIRQETWHAAIEDIGAKPFYCN